MFYFCLLLLFAIYVLLRISYEDNSSIYDINDTGMDFFHSIEYVNGLSPYKTFNTLYPPLANLLFFGLFHCIPTSVSNNWPVDFIESVHMRTTHLDLRVNQAPLLIYFVFIMLCVYMIIVLAQSQMEDQSLYVKRLVSFNAVFSYGILMAIERGNILLITVPLTMFFVFYRNSDNKLVKEISFIALAIAAGLKVYPAIFGLLLKKKTKRISNECLR